MHCAIWYHLYNLKNVKNTHGGVLILVKLLKLTLLQGCFSRFLYCANGTKSLNASHLSIPDMNLPTYCSYVLVTKTNNQLGSFSRVLAQIKVTSKEIEVKEAEITGFVDPQFNNKTKALEANLTVSSG